MNITLVPKPPLYTEEYVVRYKVTENGLEITRTKSFFATKKGAHEKVAKVFKHKYPKATIVNITYQ